MGAVDTPRGPISFDDHGNVVIDVYGRRAEKPIARSAQFWMMAPTKFLSQPVFSRDFPPMKG